MASTASSLSFRPEALIVLPASCCNFQQVLPAIFRHPVPDPLTNNRPPTSGAQLISSIFLATMAYCPAFAEKGVARDHIDHPGGKPGEDIGRLKGTGCVPQSFMISACSGWPAHTKTFIRFRSFGWTSGLHGEEPTPADVRPEERDVSFLLNDAWQDLPRAFPGCSPAPPGCGTPSGCWTGQ